MTKLFLMILSLIGMGYCLIVGAIETVKAIFGPLKVLDVIGGYGIMFVVCFILFIMFGVSRPVD